MLLFLLSLNILFGSALSQTCGQASPSGVLALSSSDSNSDCYFLGKLTNPAVPCRGDQCTPCANNLAARTLRVSGDWSKDAGSATEWNAAEPLGLLKFDERHCVYTLVISGLRPAKPYKWKVTADSAWSTNYGCGTADCLFTANSEGAVRFVVKPTSAAPALTHDFNLGVCGDGVCEAGESCEQCPEDCGTCPPTTTRLTTTTPSTPRPVVVTSNPVKPCESSKCPDCANNLSSKLLRVTGMS